MDLFTRPYQPKDRDAIFRIAADTAFFGEPVEAFLEDRRLFCDALYRYYLDFESRHIRVACAGTQAVGFLVGCLDTKRRDRIWITRLLPWMVWRILRGVYRFGPRTRGYTRGLAGELLTGNIPRADLRAFPAHLHVNVAAAWRGLGLGRSLLTTYLEFLHRSGIAGVHLETTDRNIAACRLYEALGFKLLEERPSTRWGPFLQQPVANRCYGLAFSQAGW